MKLFELVTLRLVLVVLSTNDDQIFIVWENILCDVLQKGNLCPMLHSAVKFRQNMQENTQEPMNVHLMVYFKRVRSLNTPDS